jgi:hypothetical protein
MSPTLYQDLVYFLIAVASASVIIVFITYGSKNENGLYALIGGYSGIMLCLVGIIMINLSAPNFKNSSSLFSCVSLLVIVAFLIAIISIYFDKIATSQVSDYYNTFSFIAFLLIGVQVFIIMKSLYNSSTNSYFSLSLTQRSLLVFFSVIAYAALIVLFIILKLYSTQG